MSKPVLRIRTKNKDLIEKLKDKSQIEYAISFDNMLKEVIFICNLREQGYIVEHNKDFIEVTK